MEWFLNPQEIFVIAILILLEIALSVDNLAGMRQMLSSLPEKMRVPIGTTASVCGLAVRIGLVLLLLQLSKLLDPFFAHTVFASGRGALLSFGGGFLIVKALSDLKQHLNREDNPSLERLKNPVPSLGEILIYDALLSIDSIVAALALASNLNLVIIAMVIAHLFLNIFWKQIDNFFATRPSMMTVSLCFLFVLGLVSMVRILGLVLTEETLIAALIFALTVELINGRTFKQPAAETSQAGSQNTRHDAIDARNETIAETALAAIPSGDPVGANLFTTQTCNSCFSTTLSAFPFCMSCGHGEPVEVKPA